MASVQFILGRSGTGKSRWCIDAVCDVMANGGMEPLILLVPEQATYQVERSILSTPNIAGFSRLHVLSFNRLGFWLKPQHLHTTDISQTGSHFNYRTAVEHPDAGSAKGQRAGQDGQVSGEPAPTHVGHDDDGLFGISVAVDAAFILGSESRN